MPFENIAVRYTAKKMQNVSLLQWYYINELEENMREELNRNEAMTLAGSLLEEEHVIREMELSGEPAWSYTTQFFTLICC